MLQPANRLTLIDAMRPPPGYTFNEAVAVTFTLDLRALLAAPAAFALANDPDASDRAEDPAVEPIELLHAIRRHADHLTVFSQAGEISLPPSRKVFAFFERAVVPVVAPRHGLVHPKVWVLSYVAQGEPARLRVLSASRNLTFDTSWDTLLRLDSIDGEDDGVGLEPLAGLFRRLPTCAIGGAVAAEQLDRIERVCQALERTRFALPGPAEHLDVHVLGLDAARSPLPAEADRSLVISPFVSADFVSTVHKPALSELVSRASTLDALDSSVLSRVGVSYVFDDGSTPELDRDEDKLSREDPGRPLRGLHAKVFAYEAGDRAQLFLGSANATGAAFLSNVEVLFELTGPRSRLGIDALLTSSEDELGLRRLFQTYVRTPEGPVEQPDGSLDAARRAIGRLGVAGEVTPHGEGWVVRYRSTEPVLLPDGAACECWPLASAGNRTQVSCGSPLDVEFAVSLEHISGFLAFELSDSTTRAVTSFVVPVRLDGLPEERDRLLLRSLIGSAERFLRYLLVLLADQDSAGGTELSDLAEVLEGADGHRDGARNLPVLEVLLRSLRTDPKRILAIDPLVKDLDADEALPSGFADLWALLRDLAEVPA